MPIRPLIRGSGSSGHPLRGGSRPLARGLALVVLALGVLAGSARARVEFQHSDSYPPGKRAPLKLIIVPPVDTFDFSAMRDRVVSQKESSADFQTRLRCIWSEGFARFARECGVRVTVVSEVLADPCRTGPTRGWLQCTRDALGVPRFQVTDSTRLAALRSGGFDLAVVPRSLVVREVNVQALATSVSGTLPSIKADVAVLDVASGAVVWAGVVACPAGELAGTSYDRLSYSWLADLLESMHRLNVYTSQQRILFSRKWCP